MNRNLEENRIRKLFRELREDDERLAPSFDSILRPALMKRVSFSRSLRLLRAAIITAALALIATLAYVLLTPSSPTVDDAPEKVRKEKIEGPVPPMAPESKDHKSEIAKKAPRKQYRRRSQDKNLQAARLISEWQSPTGILLEPAGNELFTTLPKTGESVVEIRWTLPREKN